MFDVMKAKVLEVVATSGEFEVWARHFLAQEVRINIWIRYMEHKKKNLVRQEDPVLLGQYL